MEALNEKEKEAQGIIINEVDKAVTLLVTHLEKFCTENQALSVPIAYVKESARIMLKSYKDGAQK